MTKENDLQRAVRLAREAQAPLEQLRKNQELVDQLTGASSALQRVMKDLANSPAHRMARQFQDINQHSALLAASRAVIEKPAIIEQMEAAQRRADEMRHALDRAMLPHKSLIAEMAEQMAIVTEPYRMAMARQAEWQSKLERQMRAVQLPWVSSHHTSLSIEGFAVVSRLNTVVRNGELFGDVEREIIDDDLGHPIRVEDDATPDDRDEAHVEAGMNPSMLAISPVGVGDVLIQTGFVLRSEYAPMPQTKDGSSPGHIFHPGHGALITSVEQHLRALIQDKMSAEFGINWMTTQVHAEVVEGWVRRRDEAVEDGESELDLIQYSNFMELKDIIIRKSHWNKLFAPIFKKKDHFSTSMERLHPIRKPLSHSRPIGIGQQFHLVSEAAIILRALNVNIFDDS